MSFIREISEQPLAMRDLLREFGETYRDETKKLRTFLTDHRIGQILFSGMGSSLYASYIPCNYLNRRGIKAYATESNELMHFGKNIIDDFTLLIAVSQSGSSAETVELCRTLDCADRTLIITNREDGLLYQYGSMHFLLHAGKERHTATKTYTNTIAALLYIAHVIAGEDDRALLGLNAELARCADSMERFIRAGEHVERISQILEESDYIALIGSGTSYCTVSHAELVFLEAGKLVASRYTVGQFTHGPVELIGPDFCAMLFDFEPLVRAKLDEIIGMIEKFGGKIVIFTNRNDLHAGPGATIVRLDCPNPFISPILEIIPVELIVHTIGMRKSCNPGVLRRIKK